MDNVGGVSGGRKASQGSPGITHMKGAVACVMGGQVNERCRGMCDGWSSERKVLGVHKALMQGCNPISVAVQLVCR